MCAFLIVLLLLYIGTKFDPARMGVEVVGRESGWSLAFAFHRVSVGGDGSGGGG